MSELPAVLAQRLGMTKDFYAETVRAAMREGVLDLGMRVLVACGGQRDRDVLLACGLRDVTISNLDTRMRGDEFAPYAWSYQDAECLGFEDGSFDFVIVHNGLHHCKSPHRALCELYRVAKSGVLVFEPRDGALVRLAVRLNFGQEYELAAVFDNNFKFGGVQNSEVPNFVYRWTEDEVQKTVQSYAPIGNHRYSFYYATRVPWERLRLMRNKRHLGAVILALPVLKVLSAVFPRVCNNFAFMIAKPSVPRDLFPWLVARADGVGINEEWLSGRYAKTS